MKVSHIEQRDKLQRVFANDWIIEFPSFVNVGKKLDIVMLEEDTKSNKYSVVLNGYVFRSYPDYSLVSCGGLMVRMPKRLTLDTVIHLGIIM